jgi:hypothetical protein
MAVVAAKTNDKKFIIQNAVPHRCMRCLLTSRADATQSRCLPAVQFVSMSVNALSTTVISLVHSLT